MEKISEPKTQGIHRGIRIVNAKTAVLEGRLPRDRVIPTYMVAKIVNCGEPILKRDLGFGGSGTFHYSTQPSAFPYIGTAFLKPELRDGTIVIERKPGVFVPNAIGPSDP